MSQDAALKVVARALDAAVDATRWHEVCDLMTEGFGLRSAAIGASDLITGVPQGLGLGRVIRDQWQDLFALMQEDGVLDQEAVYDEAILASNAHTLLSEWEMLKIARGSALPESRMRRFLKERIDMAERLGMKLNDYGPGHEVLILYTSQEKPQIKEAESGLITLTAPIISQSIRMMRVFDRLRERFNATLGALDHLGIGALLVDRKAQIIHSNAKASKILAAKDALFRDSRERLSAIQEPANRALRKACSDALATALGEGIHAQSVLTVERRSGGPAYLVTVSAVADPLAELEPDFRSALVFVVDPEDSDGLTAEGITAMGLLTEAENEVTQLLVRGASTKEIAERRQVAEETVRRQIKSVLAKLNCRSRSDVIRLALATRLPLAK